MQHRWNRRYHAPATSHQWWCHSRGSAAKPLAERIWKIQSQQVIETHFITTNIRPCQASTAKFHIFLRDSLIHFQQCAFELISELILLDPCCPNHASLLAARALKHSTRCHGIEKDMGFLHHESWIWSQACFIFTCLETTGSSGVSVQRKIFHHDPTVHLPSFNRRAMSLELDDSSGRGKADAQMLYVGLRCRVKKNL